MRRAGHRYERHLVGTRLAGAVLALLLLLPQNVALDLFAPSPAPPRRNVAASIPLPLPPGPVDRLAPPPDLPSLSVRVAVSPEVVVVGQPATITLTVTNGSTTTAATSLALTLPMPPGATPAMPGGQVGAPVAASPTALPSAGTSPGWGLVSPTAGWEWRQPTLPPKGTATFTAGVIFPAMPTGRALLAQPSVIAQGLPFPLGTTGGAIVEDADATAVAARAFVPGSAATLASADGTVEVTVPGNARAEALALRHSRKPGAGETVPPAPPGLGRRLGSFHLYADTMSGAAVHQFAAPLTLTVRYTPEQLRALGIIEGDLVLYTFDMRAGKAPGTTGPPAPSRGSWRQLPTKVDPKTHTATATVDHFSQFTLADGSSPSSLFVPSVEGFQVSAFTGAATYGVPIAVPAGAGGMKPNLTIAYSSALTDGRTGERPKQQSGWVGKGWSLDTGAIESRLTIVPWEPAIDGYPPEAANANRFTEVYTLAINGKTFNLIRGAHISWLPDDNRIDRYEWHTTDETFMRVRAVEIGPLAGHGGSVNGREKPRFRWQVWATDGTRYDFEEDLWWAFHLNTPDEPGVEVCDYHALSTYAWKLTRVVDPSGNTISYSYDRDGKTQYHERSSCAGSPAATSIQARTNQDVWPTEIVWGKENRYRVRFQSSWRPWDTDYDQAPLQLGDGPQQTRQLDFVLVESRQDGAGITRSSVPISSTTTTRTPSSPTTRTGTARASSPSAA